jgi:hypothetical protein
MSSKVNLIKYKYHLKYKYIKMKKMYFVNQ